MAYCANRIICVQIPRCTLIAHIETYLTGMLKCIISCYSSKLSKGSHDIQCKSHGSQRSSLLGTYLRQASSTSLCSSHTRPPTPPHSSYFKPFLLVVSTNSAAFSPTPTPAKLAHSLVSFRSLLQCHLNGAFFGNPV